MQHPNQQSWRLFALGLGGVLLVVFGFLAVGHWAQAVTIENVGGSLGLGAADLKQTIINVIKWALGLLGLVAIIVMLYGGFVWLTSRGDEKKIEKAKRILLNGVIGLVIILVSWAIVLFVQRFITRATNTANASGQCRISEGPAGWGPCNVCVNVGNPDPDIGELQPIPGCPAAGPKDYYAGWKYPRHEQANVKLCEAVSSNFIGLTPATANDIDDGSSDFFVKNYLTSVDVLFSEKTYDANVATFVHDGHDFEANTKYFVDVTGIHSIPPDPAVASRPIPPDGWTFTTGTLNDNDPPFVAGRCSTDSAVCRVNADCPVAGDTCSSPTDPPNNATIECLSPIIEVMFNEAMLPPSVMNPANVTIIPADAGIARIAMPTPSSIQITLTKPLVKDTAYTVTLNADVNKSPTGGKYAGFKDMCLNALDCGDAAAPPSPAGTCAPNGTSNGTTLDDYSFTFRTANTDTVKCTPIVTSISPVGLHGNTASPQLITIQGSNFGLNPVVRFSGNILATPNGGNGSQCFNNSNLAEQADSPRCTRFSGSPTQFTTMVPTGPRYYSPTGAIDGPVTVLVDTETSPPSDAVDIQSPHINWVYPREGKAGRFVTISGQNFGASGTVTFRNNDGTVNRAAAAPSCAADPWTDTEIIVQVPEGFAFNDVTNIQVDSDDFNDVRGMSNTARFDIKNVDGPNLCSINPVESNDPRQIVDALGEGFSAGPIVIHYSNLAGNLVALTDDKNLRAQPTVNLPPGRYNFFVTVNGRSSNTRTFKYPIGDVPEVVRNGSCVATNRALLSPNPTFNAPNVCRNISVSARFTESMRAFGASSLTDPNSVYVRRCNQGATYDATACEAAHVVGTLSASTYDAAQPNDQVNFLPNGGRFESNYWYEATIKAGTMSTVPIALATDVVWHFHVRDSAVDCQADSVGVKPLSVGPLFTGQGATFIATAYDAQCSNLTGLPGNFTWDVDDANLALQLPVTTNPATAQPSDNEQRVTVPTGNYDGVATVTATYSAKSGAGKLTVRRDYCETNDDCDARCAGSTCDVPKKTCNPLVTALQSGTDTGMSVQGPAGNLINVLGCFFGSSKGTNGRVNFTQNIAPFTSEDSPFKICGPTTWTDTMIRMEAVPAFAAPGTRWNVMVTANNTLQSNNTAQYEIANICSTPAGGTVAPPATGIPILCSITPTASRPGRSVSYAGDRFVPTAPPPAQPSEVYFTEERGTAGQIPLAGVSTNVSSAKAATSTVPLRAGIPLLSATSQTTVGTPSAGDVCVATPVNFAISCTQHSECNSGCCALATKTCQPDASTCTDGIIQSSTPAGQLDCRNTAFEVVFAKDMLASSVTPANIQLIDNGSGLAVATRFGFSGRRVTLTPTRVLEDGTYHIFVRGGVSGVTAADRTYLAADTSLPLAGVYTVNNFSVICKVATTRILGSMGNLNDDRFTCSGDTCPLDEKTLAGNQHAYTAEILDSRGNSLSIDSVTWTQGDATGTFNATNVYQTSIAGDGCTGASDGVTYCATAANVANGSERLSLEVVGSYDAGTGTKSIPIRAFMCTNPWPAAPNPWPFRDPVPSDNFTFAFCRDAVGGHSLDAPVDSPGFGEIRKEYFMFVLDSAGDRTGDTIGIRVLGNTARGYGYDLSPKRWYKHYFGKESTGTTLEVDGYPALREGRTVYVVADNYIPDPIRLSYPNVYVISYNDKAKAETVGIFDQILKNIRFNDIASDPFLTPQVQQDLRTDLKRIHAMEELVFGLSDYFYAHNKTNVSLETGTYLKYLSFSAWPSWQQTLGSTLGITMPRDPEAKWDPQQNPRQAPALCGAGFDQTTCWNETTKVMQFPSRPVSPADSHGFAFRYTPGDPSAVPPVPPEVDLFGTGSSRIHAHVTDTIGVIAPNVNICPAGNTCQGFNMVINSDRFTLISNHRLPSKTDTTQPLVSIDAPANGSVVTGLVPVVITATDEAGGSGMQRVELVVRSGATVISSVTLGASDRDGKYRWTWDSRTQLNSPPQFSITATAYDRAGNSRVAPAAMVTLTNPPGDTTPPVITASAPPDEDAGTPGYQWNIRQAPITVTASATDNQARDTGVSRLDFYLGTSKVGQHPATPCTAACPGSLTGSVDTPSLDTFTPGQYKYSVVAYDLFGNSSIMQYDVSLRRAGEAVPPAVSILTPTTQPAPDAIIFGTSADVYAEASDAGSGVDRVEFYVDTPAGNMEAAPRAITFREPYIFTWTKIDQYTDGGTYHVQAVAYDRAGNSSSVTTTVQYQANAGPDTEGPTMANILPANGSTVPPVAHLQAEFRDNRALQRIELRIDGNRIPLISGTDYTRPTTRLWLLDYIWHTLAETSGQHTVSLTAYDQANFTTTASFAVIVANDVILSITSPATGSTVRDSASSTFHCDNDATKLCRTNADCTSIGICSNNPSRNCTADGDCSSVGTCSNRPTRSCTVASNCGVCSNAPSRSCNVGSLCSLGGGNCVSVGATCNGVGTGTCTGRTHACVQDAGFVPVTVSVGRTCRGDRVVANLDLYLDPKFDGTDVPFYTFPAGCSGSCTYNWTSLTTANGSHKLVAIGRDSTGCQGGATSNIRVSNTVNDTTPPSITRLSYGGTTWTGNGPVYINDTSNDIVLEAADNAGGSGLARLIITVKNAAGNVLYEQDCGAVTPCVSFTGIGADGSGYTVTAHVADVAGNAVDLVQTVNVDTTPPTAAWVGPADGTTVASPATITMQGQGTDPQSNGYASGIARLEYWNGAALVATGSAENPAGSGIFPSVLSAVGTYQMLVRAFDRANNQSVLDAGPKPLTITGPDNTPPNVSITNPDTDNYFFGGTLSITAAASDNAGGSGMASVEFFRNNVSMGPADTASPWSFSWNTTTVPNGSYSITARACDNVGNCTVSGPRIVFVNNNNGNNCGPIICSGTTPNCCEGPPWQCQNSSQACAAPGGGAF